MQTTEQISDDNGIDVESSPSFLVIAVGGAGKNSALAIKKRHLAAGKPPFSLTQMIFDTERTDFAKFDRAVDVAPTPETVAAMKANPKRYGKACQAIVQYHPNLLHPETLGHGARTCRSIMQASFELFEDRIIKELREAIHLLLRQGNCRRIIPIVVASCGGGTGSSAAVLLLDIFMDTVKKSQIVLGLPPELVARPVLFCIDAYSHALMQINDVAPAWILANVYATRVELAEYEKRGKGYEYIFHIGLGNDAGSIFPTIEQVCEANGQLCWEWMANYSRFKNRAVDGLDFYKTTCRYLGDDIPENQIPNEHHPPYAAPVDRGTRDEHVVQRDVAGQEDVNEGSEVRTVEGGPDDQ